MLPRHLRTASLLPALILALSTAALPACHLGISLDAEARSPWTRDYTLADGGTLEIRSTNGSIHLAVGDGDAVRIEADRIVNAATQEAADTALETFEIGEQVTDDRIVLDSTTRGMNVNLSRKVNYRVTLPRGANVKISGTNSNVEADGIEGRFDVGVTNGRVVATALKGPATVETTNGAVSLSMARLASEGVECQTTNGAITVMLPEDAGADIAVRVTNGGISYDGLDVQVIEQSRRRFDATLGGGGPRVRLEATNGAIRLRPNR
jgi:DUF4097 and DUF4098 domain-containing protein YvlB